MTEFNTDLPGVRQVQGYIKDKQEVELKLITDDLVVGKILWQDADSLCMEWIITTSKLWFGDRLWSISNRKPNEWYASINFNWLRLEKK